MKRTSSLWSLGLVALFGACTPNATPETENARSEPMKLKGVEVQQALADEEVFLLDVRAPKEIAELGTVEGYVNIPLDQLPGRLGELPRDKPILTA